MAHDVTVLWVNMSFDQITVTFKFETRDMIYFGPDFFNIIIFKNLKRVATLQDRRQEGAGGHASHFSR